MLASPLSYQQCANGAVHAAREHFPQLVVQDFPAREFGQRKALIQVRLFLTRSWYA